MRRAPHLARRPHRTHPYARAMTDRPDPHDRRPEEQHDEPQAEQRIDELERQRRRLEAHCDEYEEALHATYAMLDRYADEVSDEAYHAIEKEILAKTHREVADSHKVRSILEDLEAEVERLRDALRTLKRNARSVLCAKEVSPRQWKGLSSSIATARGALEAAEDGQNE